MTYIAPLKDHHFLLHDILGAEVLSQTEQYEDATLDIFDAVLEEAAKFSEGVLAPLNRSADEQGCTFKDGRVTTPDGFKEAYNQFVEGGWPGLSLTEDYGGQNLPHSLYMLVDEIITTANNSFAMYRGLIDGAFNTILRFGSDELKSRWLGRLASGEVLPTMNLTEPHAGSDLGLLSTKAVPDAEGTYAITGAKIFITGGESDLTENLLHLVLARLPDAPKGSRGISLFLVPKFLEDGTRNAMGCSGIEHKMGIKGSATCALNYDGAKGWLLGEPHSGLMAMFTMMNAARLGTGVQGLCASEGAMQIAAAYAAERKQGRAPGKDGPAPHTIDKHPDVQRMLRTQKAFAQGGRALALRAALQLDLSHAAADAGARKHHDAMTQFLTPVVKAFLTDTGCESASLGIQIMGGHGYIREWGVEQWYRDVRIAAIYEGTNGIQAMDLVGRKLGMMDGQITREVFGEMRETMTAAMDILPEAKVGLEALDVLVDVTAKITAAGHVQSADGATDFLTIFGLVALAREWAGIAIRSAELKENDPEFHEDKLVTAKFYMTRILPRYLSHAAMLNSVVAAA